MSSAKPAPRRLLALCAHWLLIAAVFAGMTAATWNTWPDIIVDYGHQLYIPWRLCEGDVLYRDITYPMGPVSQYFMAAWFLVLGPSLQTAVVANLLVLAGLVVLLHGLFRRLGSDFTATTLVIFFLAVFGFSQFASIGNYTYVCPYRHEVTHGLALCVLQIWCLARWQTTQRLRWLAVSGAVLGLTLLVKAEFAVPALAVALWTGLAFRRSLTIRSAAALLLPAALVVAATWAALCTRLSPAEAAAALWLNWQLSFDPQLTANSGFYRGLSGVALAPERLVRMAVALVYCSGLGLMAWGADWSLRRLTPNLPTRIAAMLPVLAAGVFVLPVPFWHLLPQCFLVFDVVVLAVCGWKTFVRRQESDPRTFLLGAWAVLAVFVTPKMVLSLSWGHYGFVLAVPSALLVLHLALFEAPRWLRSRGGGPFYQAVMLGIVSACALSLAWQSLAVLSTKTLAFGEGRDQFWVSPRDDNRALALQGLLRQLKTSLRPEETLLVIPDGTMLNFQLRRRNPTGHVLFSPWEAAAFGDDVLFEAVRSHPPDVIVRFTTDMSVHGRGNFGSPLYGAELKPWIEREYRLESRLGEIDGPPGSFGALVFRRTPRP